MSSGSLATFLYLLHPSPFSVLDLWGTLETTHSIALTSLPGRWNLSLLMRCAQHLSLSPLTASRPERERKVEKNNARALKPTARLLCLLPRGPESSRVQSKSNALVELDWPMTDRRTVSCEFERQYARDGFRVGSVLVCGGCKLLTRRWRMERERLASDKSGKGGMVAGSYACMGRWCEREHRQPFIVG